MLCSRGRAEGGAGHPQTDSKRMSGLCLLSTLSLASNRKESSLEITVDRQVINRKLKTGLVRKWKTVK